MAITATQPINKKYEKEEGWNGVPSVITQGIMYSNLPLYEKKAAESEYLALSKLKTQKLGMLKQN